MQKVPCFLEIIIRKLNLLLLLLLQSSEQVHKIQQSFIPSYTVDRLQSLERLKLTEKLMLTRGIPSRDLYVILHCHNLKETPAQGPEGKRYVLSEGRLLEKDRCRWNTPVAIQSMIQVLLSNARNKMLCFEQNKVQFCPKRKHILVGGVASHFCL